MKMTRKIAAIAAAMAMAVSASADDVSKDNDNMYVDVGITKSGDRYTATGYAKNYTAVARLLMVQAFIYDNNENQIAESHYSSVVGYGKGIFSPEASTTKKSNYAEGTGVLYNGNVIISGQYDALRTNRNYY